MFIEHRTYTIQPGKLREYLDTYGKLGWEVHGQNMPCVGHYYTDVGAMNRVVTMWQYDSLEDRTQRSTKLMADPRWKEALSKIAPLVTNLQSDLLLPSPFWAASKAEGR